MAVVGNFRVLDIISVYGGGSLFIPDGIGKTVDNIDLLE
jgi:hypothetical protein